MSARPILAPVACVLLLCGCATYHPDPLPATADLARLPRLTVPSASLGLPGLRSEPFDPARGLSEINVITLAVAANPQLKAERLRAAVARAQLLEAGLLPDPQLSGGMSWSSVRTGYDAALGEDIRALVTRGAARRAAAAHGRQVSLVILWQEWQVAERARELYVEVAALDALRGVLQQRRGLLDSLARRDEAALARGDVSAVEVAADFDAWRGAEADRRSFELADNQARHALDGLLGLEPGVQLRLRGQSVPQQPLSVASYRAALAALPDRRPDLLALQAGYRSADETLREAILAQFPLVSAGIDKARSAEEGVRTVGFNVTFTLPLFDRNQGAIALGRATRDYLRQSYQVRLDEARGQADQLRGAVAIMRRELGELEMRLPKLESAAAAAKESLGRGELGLAAYAHVQSNSLAARAEAIRLRASLEQAQAALGLLLALPY